MYIISDAVAAQIVSIESVMPKLRRAFEQLERGQVELLPVAIGKGLGAGTTFGVKGGLIRGSDILGFKFGSYWPQNAATGRPTHGSTTVLLDPETSFPMALIGAKGLSAIRTAALDALAIERLSRPESQTLAMVGSGHLAWWELMAACLVRPISRVLVWAPDRVLAERFVARARAERGLEAEVSDLAAAVSSADIVITATPSSVPLVEREWVRAGTHISAMGADVVGKQELSVELVSAGRRFADIVEQSITLGEFKDAYAQGRIARDSITPIGAVLNGTAAGRSADEITIFDSSGTALQDLVIGDVVLQEALARGLAITVDADL